MTGTLTLDAQGKTDAFFLFQIGSTLTTASNASVVVINGEDACNVYFQVGTSATLGTDTAFEGNILALTSITLNTGADVTDGRVLAQNGAVTLDTNNITIVGCPFVSGSAGTFDTANAVPEPGSIALLAGLGLSGAGFLARRRRTALKA